MLPIAMILGAILYNPITVLNEKLPHLTQALIFAMLLVPYCRISLRELRIERLHIWLITIQIIGSLAVYGVLLLFDPLIAEGTLICILAPTATAAAVITFMLGGSLTTLATYSLLSNMTVALLSPIIFSFIVIVIVPPVLILKVFCVLSLFLSQVCFLFRYDYDINNRNA